MSVDEIAIEIEDSLREDYEALCNYSSPLEAAQAAKKDVADFKAAVIQAERRRILDNSLFQFGMGDGTYMMIRTSVVDPKETP